ncbi:LAMI_0G02366g1_1 [Lachancea mirantina]|uniref:Dol-P-Glc:Glc(2)Man(9)GlcNAc(2)-PP-Dol alpha-1,2-glucosyltransferase n=1 Tax=Lachancea mirantina TaxID=1230905 RepID=A0A1G4K7S8_9SACH|nr:LAMI_0G02366g1_1 [Lachancea mirantina]
MPKEGDISSEKFHQELEQDIKRNVEFGFLFNLLSWPAVAIITSIVFYRFNKNVVPFAFIDEVFHLGQTVQYINGNWKSWDPKITTPPGLYVLGWIQYKLLHGFVAWSPLTALRLLNLFGGLIVWPWVVLRPLFLFSAVKFWPINLMCFPLLFTFYFLYYTDVWSTIFIVESLTLAITLPFGERKSIWASALCGLVSCLFRQTNIVWNLFVMIIVIERRALIQRDFNNVHFNNYLKLIIHSLENFHQLVLPYALNFMLFLAFLAYNRSITLGDKSNHTAGIHLVQFFYCIAFIAIFSAPIWISRRFVRGYLRYTLDHPLGLVFQWLGMVILIRYFTRAHPFLLADNRHYTFYLFKKIITRNKFFKYLVMPASYHFSIYSYMSVMHSNIIHFHPILPIEIKSPVDLPVQLTHISWTALLVCTFITVVPSPLFEPRYYILPYIFWRIFVSGSPESYLADRIVELTGVHRLSREFLWFALINVFTLTVFAFKPIVWQTESFPQRIIW